MQVLKNDGLDQDVLTDVGLERLLLLLARCRRGALIWLAIPCSSWVWIGWANSGRSGRWPTGNDSLQYTALHNNIAEVSAHIESWATTLGLQFVIEQPLTSVLFDYWPVRRVFARHHEKRISLSLQSFGAQSQKMLELWGTTLWLHDLQQYAQWLRNYIPPAAETLCLKSVSTVNGRPCITGKKQKLKDSSAYPHAFGVAVAHRHKKHMQQIHGGHADEPFFSLLDNL